MKLMRVFSGVVFGYLLFGCLWRGLFRVTDTDPHAPASISFEFGAIVFGMLFALLAGYIASFIGGRRTLSPPGLSARLMRRRRIVIDDREGGGVAADGALLFMAPAEVVGGWTYVLRATREDGQTMQQ